jgi:hypothetical protein
MIAEDRTTAVDGATTAQDGKRTSTTKEITMFRKIVLALAASAALGAAALAPTTASAHSGWYGSRHYGPYTSYGHHRYYQPRAYRFRDGCRVPGRYW